MNAIVEARPDTVHWGYFEAARPAMTEIASGERVTIRTISGAANVTPSDDSAFTVSPEQRAIHNEVSRQMLPGHILTGPVAVKGAKPGMVLEVRIVDVELAADWGWNIIRPGAGALPDDFEEEKLFHIALDKQRQIGILPWGQEVPLAPFFGVMGVAPSADRGTLTSIIPSDFGGNMDLKELIPGTILYLPIFVEGAHFSVGDGLQGREDHSRRLRCQGGHCPRHSQSWHRAAGVGSSGGGAVAVSITGVIPADAGSGGIFGLYRRVLPTRR